MINKVAQPVHQEIVELSSQTSNSINSTRIDSTGLIHADQKTLNLASISAKEKFFYMNKSRSISLTNEKDFSIAGIQSPEKKSATEKTLINNLLAYLHVGSNDSLNIMKDIFKFHRYNTILLDRYIRRRTPENLRALKIQIENRLFMVNDQKTPRINGLP